MTDPPPAFYHMSLHEITGTTMLHLTLNQTGRQWLASSNLELPGSVDADGTFICSLNKFIRVWGSMDPATAQTHRAGPLYIILDA